MATTRVVPGVWKCSRCGFFLVRRVLYVRTGNLGEPEKTNDVAEPCPNDGVMLEQETEDLH